ncbi:hypothetical protein EI555_006365, partial [Monodon monoceros]
GEINTRFSFCVVATLALLGKLDAINVEKAIELVLSCMNFDGGFGCRLGSESHAGQIYCCTGFLAITRQEKLHSFILACQDEETGGFADRPGDMVDPFHTLFGIAGLSPLGEEQMKPVSPVFCMPEEILR